MNSTNCMKALPIQYTRPKILDRLSVVIAYIYHSGQGDIPDVIMNQGGANLIKDLKGSKKGKTKFRSG